MPQPQSDLTLREHVVAAIRSNRELIEHLEQGFIPKVHSLRRVTRPDRDGSTPPGDKVVHAAAATVLEADHFTVGVYQRLIAHCELIREAVQDVTGSRQSNP
ncbi:MAG: hypothetical protein M3552_10925 [Planctomycetota bacterium]|nr:hypothetical protein [Planctomycetaceae bacterium]MDQ3331149.1 hypothetical protein [Planctomycetota bacterium]